jgi:hypothetical protein
MHRITRAGLQKSLDWHYATHEFYKNRMEETRATAKKQQTEGRRMVREANKADKEDLKETVAEVVEEVQDAATEHQYLAQLHWDVTQQLKAVLEEAQKTANPLINVEREIGPTPRSFVPYLQKAPIRAIRQ